MEKPKEMEKTDEHAEAVAFFDRHMDFFEHYAKGKVKVLPAPEGLETFAFNLENDEIYANSRFYKDRGFSDERTLFAICHEIEHFSEKKAMLSEDGGEKKFEKYLGRIKTSEAFSLTDNCTADIRENRSVVSRTNEGMGDIEEKMYTEDLFKETDFTEKPRHIQFNYALLREARVPGEKCTVSEDVRKELDEVSRVKGLTEIMTDPDTPMSTRLKLLDKYIWPKVEKLLEKDMEDKKKEKPASAKGSGEAKQKKKEEGEPSSAEGSGAAKKEKGEQGNEEGDGDEGNKENEPKDGDKGKQGKDEKPKKGKGGEPDEKPKDGEGGEQGDPASAPSYCEEKEDEETDPNKIFADDYAEAKKKFPEAVPIEDIEKAFKEWKEAQKEKPNADKADADYAEKIGVDKKDLQNYRNIVNELEKIVNPETNVGLREELRNLFLRIISKRLKTAMAPRYPVDEGDELVDPAQLVADVKSGNLEPKVWEDTEIKEKKGDQFGEVEITFVFDRSSSMVDGDGKKAIEQQKCGVLGMEVLGDFSELCNAEKINMDKPLEVKSEIYSFASSDGDKTPLKKMSSDLGEAERINVLKKLYDCPGSTTDFVCLKAIDENIDDETLEKIKTGELKKIVIVFTDGGSDKPAVVQAGLKSLRGKGVVAIGVGITKEGSPVLTTYAPDAMVVEEVDKLTLVFGELLKEHLKDL